MIIEAIPAIQGLFHSFLQAYAAWEVKNRRSSFQAALAQAIKIYDQRDLEDASISGVPSNKSGMQERGP